MTAIRILVLSFLIPSEFNFTLGSLVLNPYRLVLICLAPYMIYLTISKSRNVEWGLSDALALAIGTWPIIAFTLNTDLSTGLESGGILALELILPYFLIRLNVNTHEQRIAFAKTLFLMVSVLFLLGLPDAIFGRHFIRELSGILAGSPYSGIPEQRFGIWRALGPTDHGIIFGTLCATAFPAAVILAKKHPKFWVVAVLSVGGTIISASSAPILAMTVQLGMLVWARLTQGLRFRWWLLLGLFIVFYFIIDIISNRDPIRVMFTYLLINPQTGYARYYMWTNSISVAAQSTWGLIVGYGYSTEIFSIIDNFYWRNLLEHTIDSFWLVLMLRFGVTSVLLYLILVILVFSKSLNYVFSSNRRRDRYFMQAWFIAAFAMTLIAATVHFWGYVACVYMMLIAVCAGGKSKTRKRRRTKANHLLTTSKPFTRARLAHA